MKKILLLASLATLGLASCDINDVENIGEMSASVFPATEEDAEAVLAGVYQVMNETMADPQASSFLYYSMLASDDQLGGGGTNDKLMQALDLMLNSSADMTNNMYSKHYTGISRANVLIESLGANENKNDFQKAALGEALTMRAFYYYELSSMYGNVPLVRNANEAENKQGDVTVLWGQILQDLRDAIELMPDVRRIDGHLDKYTAEAILGRAWLYYTGMYCNGTDIAALTSTTYNPLTEVALPDGTTLTKTDVIKYIDDCVDNSGYSLVPDFRSLWAYTNSCTQRDYEYAKDAPTFVEDNAAVNPESMFAIKFNKFASWDTGNTIGFANGLALHIGARGAAYAETFPFGQGWGAGPIAENLMTDWANLEPNDKRREASVQDWDQIPTYKYNDDFVQATRFHNKKWCPITSKKKDSSGYWCTYECEQFPKGWEVSGFENFQLGNIHDLVMIRFAEVLLMQSELKEDVTGINKVRDRAGLNPISAYSLKALQNERRWEFAGEAIRWNDIRRWHIAAAALEKQTDSAVKFCAGPWDKNKKQGPGYTARYNATAGFAKMPETQVSLGVVVQNPGWDGADSNYSGWVN